MSKRATVKIDEPTKETVLTLPESAPGKSQNIDSPLPVTRPLVKNVTSVRTERFTEVATQPDIAPVPAPSPPPQKISSEGEGATQFTQEPEELLDTADVVRALVDQIENENADYVLSIFRLPNFQQDGKTGTRSTIRKYLDRLPVTLDYLPEIKDRFGGGTYQIFLLTPKRNIKARWIEHIDGPAREDKSAALVPAVVSGFSPLATAEPESQLTQLLKFGQMWKELRQLVLDTGPAPVTTTPVAAPVVMNPATAEESDPELDLILGLLNSANPRATQLAEGMIVHKFGSGSPEPSMGDLLSRLIEPFVPAVQTGLVEYFKTMSRTAAPGTKNVTARGHSQPGASVNVVDSAADGIAAGTVPDSTADNNQLPPTNEEEQMPDEPYLDLIENLIMLMGVAVHQPPTFDAMVDQGVELVRAFQEQEPDFADWIDSLLLMAPKGVLTSLVMLIPDAAPLRSNPEALRYVEQLQVKLKATAPAVADSTKGETE